MNEIGNIILQTIDTLVDRKIEKLKKTEVFKTVILGKNSNGTYKINYLNKEHNVSNALVTDDLQIGQLVWITIPNGVFRDMHISGIVR